MESTSSLKFALYAAALAGILVFISRALAKAQATPAVPDATVPSGATDTMGGTLVKLTDSQKEMVALIQDKANGALLDPAFMVCLAVTESSLNPNAIGDDGKSMGLFQLTLDTIHYWNPDATAGELLVPEANADWAMLDMRKYITDFPGHTYGDYAEAWTLGANGRFNFGRRNPQKVQHMQQAANDLGLTLNLNEVPT